MNKELRHIDRIIATARRVANAGQKLKNILISKGEADKQEKRKTDFLIGYNNLVSAMSEYNEYLLEEEKNGNRPVTT